MGLRVEEERRRRVVMFAPYVSERAVERVVRTLRSGYIGEGPVVAEFEEEFRRRFGIPYVVALNSCTSALHLALVLAGVGVGDEVITTAQTMMATSHAVLMQGARPVYADIQYLTGNIDPSDIEHRITERTKAVLCVHWGGYPCDLDEINALARSYGLTVIEDAAHALGAFYRGRFIGSISSYTCFSFQAIKHLTTGDGGLLALTDEEKFHEARRRKWFGIDRVNRRASILGEPEWNVTELGFKYQMNDIAASLGVEHLREFMDILDRRIWIASWYRRELSRVDGVMLFEERSDRRSAYWLFPVHVERREDFCRAMRSRGVEVSVVHLRIDRNDVFGGVREDLPVLARFTESQVCLPIHNLLTDDDVSYVIDSVKKGW